MEITNQKLKLLIEDLDLIPKDNLETAFNFAQTHKEPLATVLVDRDLISDDNIGQIIADEFGFNFVDLDTVSIDAEVLQLVPKVMAKKQQIVVFGRDEKGIKLAMVNPGNLSIVNLLEKKTGQPVRPYYTTPQNIENALVNYQKGIEKEFTEIIHENVSQTKKRGVKAEDVPVIRIVDTILEYAYENKASDVHIEPGEEKSLIRFRIDGILHDIIDLPSGLHGLIVTRLKIMSRLRTDEHFSAQDGKIRMKFGKDKLDIRISIVPIVEGEKVVMRLLSERSRQFSLEDLGMTSDNLVKVKKEYMKPYGMVLTTGPTGSGKTTSLYAMIKVLNKREINISTIEDPVEYDIESINQIQVNPKTNLTFASGLRSILRQDPDVIMVGEIRDEETADIAINSAMTGHLVLSTLHTNDAATAIPRFIEMKIEPFLIASTINLIIAQRLVRRNCKQCIVSSQVNISTLKGKIPSDIIAKHVGSNKKTIRTYHSKGCGVCSNTGYSGRIGIFEVMVISEGIRELIMAQANADVIQKQAVKEGMKTMVEDGFLKVLSGATTVTEVLRATRG